MANWITINVTKTGIKKGTSNYASCPIARALRAKGFKDVGVGAVYGWFVYKGIRNNAYYYWPKKVTEFIRKFDSNKQVSPFTFKVKVS